MNIKDTAPCKGCEDRCIGCHTTCGDYAEYNRRRQEVRKKGSAHAAELEFIYSIKNKVYTKANKKRWGK